MNWKIILEFIKNNWYYLILTLLAIGGFIASIVIKCKRGKMNPLDAIKASAMEEMPFWISISESLEGPENKRNNFLSLVIAYVSKKFGRNLTAEENQFFVTWAEDMLEKILATPQKKLNKAKIEQKSKYRIGG